MLELATTVTLTGPALPDFYVQYELENKLKGILPSATASKQLWEEYRRKVRQPLTDVAGHIRVRNVVLEPLAPLMNYTQNSMGGKVRTREGDEDAGIIYADSTVNTLRCWSYGYGIDLDAPIQRGHTSRYTPQRIAERVLLTKGERVGLLTNGVELRLIISEAARVASMVNIDLNAVKQYDVKNPPDAFRLLIALASPEGIAKLEDILDDARLKQSKVTGELRKQARAAVEGFVQSILDHPDNRELLETELLRIMDGLDCDEADAKAELASKLWREALVVVYRLLFILSGEAGTRERPPFTFSSNSIWRNTYSPSAALGRVAQIVTEKGADGGQFLEGGLRALFRFFEHGIQTTELTIKPLGGALFGVDAAPLVDALKWGEFGCATLLDKLLRAPRGKGRSRTLVRLSYRDLDVEELGRVYEALLELEPGITSEDMVRLRRQKLEVVVPYEQGEKYNPHAEVEDDDSDDDSDESDDEENSKNSKIKWIAKIPGPNEAHALGRFFLRVGLGRKSSGSYYTPESFVKFLVQETLGPQCDKRSPKDDPQPRAILKLNVLDPAMGSGHFLVGACRYLGERLYEACRTAAEQGLWERIPEEVAPYLPGRVQEGESTAGLSADRARAICKRLVAVNCLYGVDKNPLAVELAKVALWLESFAEGLPLTFMDHRLLLGDSLLGPINITKGGFDSPLQAPYAETPQELIRVQEVRGQLRERLVQALEIVAELDASIGLDEADIARKEDAKRRLDEALRPFVDLCTAWSGGIMMGAEFADQAGYIDALRAFAQGKWDETQLSPGFVKMLAKGRDATVLTYPLAYPEVFFPTGDPDEIHGFDAVIGNPPWDKMIPYFKEFYAGLDIRVLETSTTAEREIFEEQILQNPKIAELKRDYEAGFNDPKSVLDILFEWQNVEIDGKKSGAAPDLYRYFGEKAFQILANLGYLGFVLPSAFHANESSTGLRQLYLWNMSVRYCFSFENKRKLFEIHSSFKFATIVAQKNDYGTNTFHAGFYLHDDEWLFAEKNERLLTYDREFVEISGGSNLSFVEARTQTDLSIAEVGYAQMDQSFGDYMNAMDVKTGEELHRTKQSKRFKRSKGIVADTQDAREPNLTTELRSKGYLLLHEGKTLHQYTDMWDESPTFLVPVAKLKDRTDLLEAAQYYRLAFRMIASSTNERTAIFAMLPPSCVCTNLAQVERHPSVRSSSNALQIIAFANTFTFDFLIRLRVQASLNVFIISSQPVPAIVKNQGVQRLFTHSVLRLTCNHAGYAPLWLEQLGDTWREGKPKHSWPVLATEEERWDVRAAIDAVVAQAYGLDRDQYEHVLRSFDRASGVNPYTGICLEKWDELHTIGLEAFTKKYDPYHDIPLVETLPQPVIDLKLPRDEGKDVPRDLFGDPLPTDLFGNVIHPDDKKKRR